METTKRRSRFVIEKRGGNFTITKNDLAILALFDVNRR